MARLSQACHSFAAVVAAMREKDAALYAVVGPLPIATGIKLWKEKYPEDFPEFPDMASMEIQG